MSWRRAKGLNCEIVAKWKEIIKVFERRERDRNMTCHHEIQPNDILKNDTDESHALQVISNSFKNDFQDIQQNCLKQNDIQQNDI